MEEETLQTIIQGGAVGVAISLIILIYFILKWIFKILGNHINHNTEILTKLNGSLEANTKVLDKIERKKDI